MRPLVLMLRPSARRRVRRISRRMSWSRFLPEVPFVASHYHGYNGLYSASHLRPLHTLRYPWKISWIIEPFAVYEGFTTGRLWATQGTPLSVHARGETLCFARPAITRTRT